MTNIMHLTLAFLPLLIAGCAESGDLADTGFPADAAFDDLTSTWRGMYHYIEPDGKGCVDDKTFELEHRASGKLSGQGSFVLSETVGSDDRFCDPDGKFEIVGGEYTGGEVMIELLFKGAWDISPGTGVYTDGVLDLSFAEIEDGIEIGSATILLERQ